MRKKLAVLVAAIMMLTAMTAAPAFAHYCSNVSKKAGAGSIGTYNVVLEEFDTPVNRGGGFITLTDGSTFAYDVFLHQTLPDGAMVAGPGGDDECDGQAVDDALVCLGISE